MAPQLLVLSYLFTNSINEEEILWGTFNIKLFHCIILEYQSLCLFMQVKVF